MVFREKQIVVRRGEIYLVNFDPALGSEIRKIRPALIIQNDIDNQYSPIVIVAAITSSFEQKLYPTEVCISARDSGLDRDSVAQLNQIRAIDKQRLKRRVGVLDGMTMSQVDKAILINLGLIEI